MYLCMSTLSTRSDTGIIGGYQSLFEMEERDKKIASVKEKMSGLAPESEAYQTYAQILETLVGLHKRAVPPDPNDNICESCQ